MDAYFEETFLPQIRDGDAAKVKLMGYPQVLHGRVQSVARGISVANAAQSASGLAQVNPVFTFVRLAQRVPVRIHLEAVPADLRLVAGMTATVTIVPGDRAAAAAGPADATPRVATGAKGPVAVAPAGAASAAPPPSSGGPAPAEFADAGAAAILPPLPRRRRRPRRAQPAARAAPPRRRPRRRSRVRRRRRAALWAWRRRRPRRRRPRKSTRATAQATRSLATKPSTARSTSSRPSRPRREGTPPRPFAAAAGVIASWATEALPRLADFPSATRSQGVGRDRGGRDTGRVKLRAAASAVCRRR